MASTTAISPHSDQRPQSPPAMAVDGSATVVVDALPYIDLGYDEPGVREAVGIAGIDRSNTYP